jgi:hypothetical protein
LAKVKSLPTSMLDAPINMTSVSSTATKKIQ